MTFGNVDDETVERGNDNVDEEGSCRYGECGESEEVINDLLVVRLVKDVNETKSRQRAVYLG